MVTSDAFSPKLFGSTLKLTSFLSTLKQKYYIFALFHMSVRCEVKIRKYETHTS